MFTEELKHIPDAWGKAFSSRVFRNQFLITMLVFLGIFWHNFHFLRLWQMRQGVQINDMVLNQLPPIDFSLAIFILEYFTLLTVFVFTLIHPDRMLKALQMFGLVFLARTMCVYFFALEP